MGGSGIIGIGTCYGSNGSDVDFVDSDSVGGCNEGVGGLGGGDDNY